MPPEVILGKGYSVNADYWSLGIIIYEFLCGVVPFGESFSDSCSIFETILEGKFSYPTYTNLSCDAKNFIEMLLNKNPALRTGGSIDKMKEHPWLKGVDWEELIEKKYPAPYIPISPNLEWDIERAFTKKIQAASISLKNVKLLHSNSLKFNSKKLNWDEEF